MKMSTENNFVVNIGANAMLFCEIKNCLFGSYRFLEVQPAEKLQPKKTSPLLQNCTLGNSNQATMNTFTYIPTISPKAQALQRKNDVFSGL